MQLRSGTVCLLGLVYCGRVHLARSDEDDDDQNPFETGCFANSNALPGWTKKRVCNSEDPPNASELGLCRTPQFQHKEVRLYAYDWDSAMFSGWLLQILLSELLDIPTSMETASHARHLNFYHPDGAIETITSDSSDIEALQTANKYGGDCSLASRSEANYEQCANFLSEVWDPTVSDIFTAPTRTAEESPLGVVGQEAWFVPKFSAERNSEILSYIGLQGLDRTNRRTLAELFLTPLTWAEYCENVSITNCTTPDTIALRAPQSDSDEVDRMFVDGLYTGHFTKLPANDCDLNQDTCTGTFIDYPCGWGTFSDVQTHHLGIPLTPRRFGNSSEYQREIWKAANATKSNVIMMWWYPDALYNSFLGSDAEFIKVTLPTPTQECLDNRIEWGAQCEENFIVEETSPLGVCDYPPTLLTTFASMGLKNSPSLEDGAHSPAFDVLTSFRISEHQIAQWADIKRRSMSPREIICSWAVENIDYLQTFVPETFPRVLTVEPSSPVRYATTALACIVLLCIILIASKVYVERDQRAIKSAQIDFLYLLLLGAALSASAALTMGLPPASDLQCNAQIWLLNIGMTLQIVPLLVKVAAVNRLITSGERLRRVSVTRKSLHETVALITAGLVVFLILWTTLGTPEKVPVYTLTSTETSDDESIVIVEYVCQSDSAIWRLISLIWASVMLLCGTVLAWQMRKIPALTEYQPLSRLIYSHFMFLVLFAVMFLIPAGDDSSMSRHIRSFLVSLDTLIGLGIYFMPKLFRGADSERDGSSRPGTTNSRASRICASEEFSVDSTEGKLTQAAFRAILAQKDDEIATLRCSGTRTTSTGSQPPPSRVHRMRDNSSEEELSLGDTMDLIEDDDRTFESLRDSFRRKQTRNIIEQEDTDEVDKPPVVDEKSDTESSSRELGFQSP